MGKHLNKRTINSRQLTRAQFIERALAVHGQRYDYSQTVYVMSKLPISIICPVHGLFVQRAGIHLQGGHCVKCTHSPKLTAQDFLRRATIAHGDTYTYDLASFAGYTKASRIAITCSTHGIFLQRPDQHVAGKGCRKCADDIRRGAGWVAQARGRQGTLYLVRLSNDSESFYKVGVSYREVADRYSGPLSRGGYDLEVVALYKSFNASAVYEWEQSILETFVSLRYHPKTRFEGETECFSSSGEILQIFPI